MTESFESILDESITALQAGVSIEDILTEVPEYASELRPLLYASLLLADPNPKLVPEDTKAALRAEYLAQAAELPPRPLSTRDKVGAVSRIVRRRLNRGAVLNDLITVIITVILTLTMTALVLNFTARDAIPGDFLYGVKGISENIQRFLAFSDERRAEFEEELNRIRLSEIEQLLQQNRAAVVQFRGNLETKGENLWIIEGHTIFLPDDIILIGNPQEGDVVEVNGILRTNKVFVAEKIRRIP